MTANREWATRRRDERFRSLGQMIAALDERREFARAYGFTRRETEAAFNAAEREEGRCWTLWDLVQGYTEVARGIQFQDDRLDLDKRAAALLTLAKN